MNSSNLTRIFELLDYQSLHNPTSPALTDSLGVELNWAQLAEAVTAAADLLLKLGVKARQRVLIVAENSCATVVFIFASCKIGAIAVPVNARMSSREIQAIEKHADPSLAVYTTAVSEAAKEHAMAASAEESTTVVGKIFIAIRSSKRLIDSEPLKDVAVILYTTGTTGEPKGVMLTHSNLLFAGRASAHLRSICREDRLYGALPLSHVFGLASVVMATATVGASVLLQARFKPEWLLNALTSGITVLPAVPQMHALLMNYAAESGIENIVGSQLRYVSSGAAPLDPAWKRKAESFYGLALQNGYGMTESTAGISSTSNLIGSPDISVGQPLEGIEISIKDPSAASSLGEGEILTRGPHVMLGYFNDKELTAQAIDEQGFLHTGDIGYVDEFGNLHVSGRCKELIIRGGFNVFPPEVEAALNRHPEVVQSAVIGRRGDDGDEEILAFIQRVRNSQLNEETLKQFAREQLTAYKIPGHLYFIDALPAAPTGKILKHKLVSVFADLIT